MLDEKKQQDLNIIFEKLKKMDSLSLSTMKISANILLIRQDMESQMRELNQHKEEVEENE